MMLINYNLIICGNMRTQTQCSGSGLVVSCLFCDDTTTHVKWGRYLKYIVVDKIQLISFKSAFYFQKIRFKLTLQVN